MPLYDYRCSNCGDFRQFRPMAESGLPQACPACGDPSDRLPAAPFLGADPNGPPRSDAGRIPWRSACKPGCSHTGCGS